MKRLLPVLFFFGTMISGAISIAQSTNSGNPFSRYLDGLIKGRPESALIAASQECQIDVLANSPRYAQNPSGHWILEKSLSRALQDQETDFYSTVAVWHVTDRIFLEQWGMELDTGTFSRQFVCLRSGRITFFEVTEWNIPPVETEAERGKYPSWGYTQKWLLEKNGRYHKAMGGFVDELEQPANEPALDSETKQSLDLKWTIHTWQDLKLPNALLR